MEKYKGTNQLTFNPKPSTIMHLDLNSCFATIEQQANPHLRGKPVAVAAYTTPSGCIIAPSIEAKKLGIKVGMRVKDGKLIYPQLVVLSPDPWKYRNIHLGLRRIISNFTNDFVPKSIDEFVLNLEGYPAYAKGMHVIAKEIKKCIKEELGEWLTVSVGIAPNRFLAKLGAGLHKPDGLDEINKDNFMQIYSGLKLTDLCGIKNKSAIRLNNMEIYTVRDFYGSDIKTLKIAFSSVLGYYWYLRLRGWEIDDVEFGRSSYGNSYALPQPLVTLEELSPILSKLVTKMSFRLRKAGYSACGVHVSLVYRDGGFWHRGQALPEPIFATADIYRKIYRLVSHSPYKKPVRELAVSCFNLKNYTSSQLNLFEDIPKKKRLACAVDTVNERWGNYVITPARMMGLEKSVPDRVAFGGVKELEEFTLSQ